MSPNGLNKLPPLKTHWHNRSLSSVNSDAATFYSAHAHLELSRLSTTRPPSTVSNRYPTPEPQIISSPRPTSPSREQPEPSSPKFESLRTSRQDSGFSDGVRSQASSQRTSCSSTRASRAKRTPTTTRPATKRATKGSPSSRNRSSVSSQRPSVRTRQASANIANETPHQFFYFPSLQEPAPSESDCVATTPPPPATVHYWTSDSTRRLEYAAIDAASRGMRGFLNKLVPDCMLPAASRRTRFHCDDADSDAGSVRRYRLALPEEKAHSDADNAKSRKQKPGSLGKWASLRFGRRS